MGRRLRSLIQINILSFLGFSFIALFALLSSAPLKEKLIVHQHRDGIPAVFSLQKQADSSQMVKMRLTLAAPNMTSLVTKVMAASVPGSKNFGQYLSKDEVEKITSADPGQLKTLNTWLNNNGVDSSSVQTSGNLVSLTLSAKRVNSLFNTELGHYVNTRTGAVSIMAPSVSTPIPIDEFHVSTVNGGIVQHDYNTSKFPSSGAPFDAPFGFPPETCKDIGCIMNAYGLPSTPISSQSSVAIAGFGQIPQLSDLTLFMGLTRPDINLNQTNVTFSIISIDGGVDSQSGVQAGGEASLDVQYVSALAPGATTVFYSEGINTIEGLSNLVDTLLGLENPPMVFTTSYGSNEDDVPQATAEAICNDILKLSSRGVTVLAASGDGGVAGGSAEQCTQFDVVFPASCPWLTSVGSTTGFSPEIAAGFSSGGFSNLFQTPSYQQLAVRKYLHDLGSTYNGLFDPNGRGIPDISSAGTNLPLVVDGEETTASGTSFSAPIVAAVVANINALRLALGQGSVGFLNPFIYLRSGLLNDITNGSNPGCGTEGFSAATGWDPVTGLGTPNFNQLVQALTD